MSDDTWIKLHRKILDSMVFANPDLLKVWIYCMCKATYKSRWTTVKVGRGETEVELHPGQFIFGRKSAGKKLKMNPETVRKRMDKLKKAGNITIESTTQYSIVTVVNFTRYQAKQEKSTIESTSQVPTKYQPSTNQVPQTRRVNNVENGKKPTPPEKKSAKKINDFAPRLFDYYNQKIEPVRKSGVRARKNITTHLKKYSYEDLLASIDNFALCVSDDPYYRNDPANFFGIKEPVFPDYLPNVFVPPPPRPKSREEQKIENLKRPETPMTQLSPEEIDYYVQLRNRERELASGS